MAALASGFNVLRIRSYNPAQEFALTHPAPDMDETVTFPSPALAALEKPKPAKAGIARHIGLVLGSGPSISDESYQRLRERLQISSLLLGGGYVAFFLLRILDVFRSGVIQDHLIFWMHLAITMSCLMIAWRLRVCCEHALRHLRACELLVFGGSALFFATFSYEAMSQSLSTGYPVQISSPWLLLMFTYALLIPNTWKRAATVIIPMAVLPVMITMVAQMTSTNIVEHVVSNSEFRGSTLQIGMVMTLGALIAIWGVRSMRSLRKEAFEARKLGQYQLKKLLGRGGMGEVYLAEHLMLKRPCALKMIRPDVADVNQNRVRFEREVQSTAKLTHWNTVEVYDYGSTDDGTFYYVMEYLPGLNLDQIVQMHGAMPVQRVIHLLTQVCDALAEAHCQGLIHRDIKPANIFAARRGGRYDVAKLLDFGLVRQTHLATDIDLTRDGSITGSPLYMSPEQAMGEVPDQRSDIYSIGAVAYLLLTGRPPFEDKNPMRVIMAHARDVPLLPTDLNPNIPLAVECIVMKCLSKNPDDRYATARSLRLAMLQCKTENIWSDEDADDWWKNFGCPIKKKLDAEVFELSLA